MREGRVCERGGCEEGEDVKEERVCGRGKM